MALRILFLIIGAIVTANLVLASVSLITGVNLYKKYGKQILMFFGAFAIFIVCAYAIMALLGLS